MAQGLQDLGLNMFNELNSWYSLYWPIFSVTLRKERIEVTQFSKIKFNKINDLGAGPRERFFEGIGRPKLFES